MKRAILKRFSEFSRISISGIGYHDAVGKIPTAGLIDNIYGQFPLRFKNDFIGYAGCLPSTFVLSPALRQVQSPAENRTPLFADMMKTDCNLAIGSLPQSPRVLPLNSYGMLPFFGKSSVIDDPNRIGFKFRRHSLAKPLPNGLPFPWALANELLHGLNISFRHSSRHRFH